MNRHEGSDQDVTDQDRAFMRLAIQEMKKAGLIEKTGGPFGAVIGNGPAVPSVIS